MKQARDANLIRLLLLDLDEEEIDLSGYPQDQIDYHKYLLADGGLVEDERCITIKGHRLLSKIKDKSVWNRAKSLLSEKGVESSSLRILQLVCGR